MTLPTLIAIGLSLLFRAALHEWITWLELGRQYRQNERRSGTTIPRIIPLYARQTH